MQWPHPCNFTVYPHGWMFHNPHCHVRFVIHENTMKHNCTFLFSFLQHAFSLVSILAWIASLICQGNRKWERFYAKTGAHRCSWGKWAFTGADCVRIDILFLLKLFYLLSLGWWEMNAELIVLVNRPEKGSGKAGTFGSSSREWYSGWSCMKTLITKGLIVKSSCPAKYVSFSLYMCACVCGATLNFFPLYCALFLNF